MKGDRIRTPPESAVWRSQPIIGQPRRNPLRHLCALWFIVGAGAATIVAVLIG